MAEDDSLPPLILFFFFKLDSVDMSAKLPDEKWSKYYATITQLLGERSIKLRCINLSWES